MVKIKWDKIKEKVVFYKYIYIYYSEPSQTSTIINSRKLYVVFPRTDGSGLDLLDLLDMHE